MTIQTIIDAAYRKNGINLPTSTQRTEALILLNSMISSWYAESLSVPYSTAEELTLVIGQGTYTIGTGGSFNTAVPIKIIDAYIRDSDSADHSVDISMNRWEYDAIGDKTATGRPTRLYYDPQYPLGKIYFNLLPEDAETLHLITEKHLASFTSLSAEITSLPAFYEEALIYNLAVRISLEEDTVVSPATVQIANTSKNTLENLNAIDKQVRCATYDSLVMHTTRKG
jgi:hypothetical protein